MPLQFVEVTNPLSHIPQSTLFSSSAVTTAVPVFITTIPAAQFAILDAA